MQLSSDISAVVTGGASGLGAAVAQRLAANGVKVTIFDTDKGRGKHFASSITGLFCDVDVTDEVSVAGGFAKARETFGQERICVNCAGIAPAAKTVSRGVAHDAGLFAKAINVNDRVV